MHIRFRFEYIFIIALTLILHSESRSQTHVSGYVSGEWTSAGSPYLVDSTVVVHEDSSLSIGPGVTVEFQGFVKMEVYGELNAIGTSGDSIYFTCSDPDTGWNGIHFSGATADLNYCLFQDAARYATAISNHTGAAVSCNSSNLQMRNSTVTGCHGTSRGTYFRYGEVLIDSCIFSGNSMGGSSCIFQEACDFDIFNTKFFNNNDTGIYENGLGVVIHVDNYGGNPVNFIDCEFCNNEGSPEFSGGVGSISNAIFINCLFADNVVGELAGALYLFDITEFYNCTFANNHAGSYGGALYISNHEKTVIKNSIFWGNTMGGDSVIYLDPTTADDHELTINYTDIQAYGMPFEWEGIGNINLNPQFMNPGNGDYNLASNSPCIDAGHPSEFYCDWDGTRNNMGYIGGSKLIIEPTQLTFGFVGITSSPFDDENYQDITWKLRNYRDTMIEVTDFIFNTDNFTVLSQPVSWYIPPIEEDEICIRFAPHTEGEISDTLFLISNQWTADESAGIPLSGTGIPYTSLTGEISGILTPENSPYYIIDEAIVPDEDTLIVQPGTEILFNPRSSITVAGYISVQGTVDDTIKFGAVFPDSIGGQLRIYNLISLIGDTILYCLFENNGNPETTSGSALFANNVPIKNCLFINNTSQYGGALHCGNSTLSNCLFINNQAIYYGGAIYASGQNIINCQFYDNSAERGGAVHGGNTEIFNCYFEGNFAESHGGAVQDGCISNFCCFKENQASYGGGQHNGSTFNSIFINNNASLEGGGLYGNAYNSIFLGNHCDGNGGGVRIITLMENCVVYSNSCNGSGGGIYGAGWSGSIFTVSNSILRGNSPNEIGYDWTPYNEVTVQFCNVQGGYSGLGNINEDPLFINPNTYDFHLQENSPCIDAGNWEPSSNDIEDPANPGFALYPAMGTLWNDMGAYGGPNGAAEMPQKVDDNIEKPVPDEYYLLSNYPNPFNSKTTIILNLPAELKGSLKVYNLNGQEAACLKLGKFEQGENTFYWKPDNLSSGIYFVQLDCETKSLIHKILLLK